MREPTYIVIAFVDTDLFAGFLIGFGRSGLKALWTCAGEASFNFSESTTGEDQSLRDVNFDLGMRNVPHSCLAFSR